MLWNFKTAFLQNTSRWQLLEKTSQLTPKDYLEFKKKELAAILFDWMTITGAWNTIAQIQKKPK